MDIDWQKLIVAGLTILLITYLTKKAAYAGKAGELRFGLFIKGLGLTCCLFSIVPFFVLLTENYQVNKPEETTALIGLIIGFGFFATYLLAEGFLVKGHYDKSSIYFSTPWTGVKEEKWENLQSISLNGWCYWYVLKFKSGKVIRLSSYLGGHAYLLGILKGQAKNN